MKNTLIILFLFSTGIFAQNNNKSITGYCDWETFKNPYESLQIRYKLEKQEGDVGYFQAQIRIDYEDPTVCKDPRCLGQALSFGYPLLDDVTVIYLHFKMFYSFKETYTITDLIPMKLSFPDGSKRMLLQDGFYYVANDSAEPVYLEYFFIKSVDLMLEGSPLKFDNFIESKAIVLE